MDYPLNLTVTDDFIVALKPSGFPTHRTDIGSKGFLETLEEKLQQKLFLVHRLDKDVSGLILFGKSADAAQRLTKLFSEKKITHTYLLRTQKRLDRDKIKFKTLIERQSTKMVSIRDQKPNSETLFLKIKSMKSGDVWSAQPKTGKTHQIRLHAKDLKIRIDGDKIYGGIQSPRLCLQSQEIEFEWKSEKYKFTAPQPVWLETHDLSEQSPLESIYRRTLLYKFESTDCLRLVHNENLRYRMDQYGDHWWVYWVDEEMPSQPELKILEKIAKEQNKKIWVREISAVGRTKIDASLWSMENPNSRWFAQELGFKYELRSDQGVSPGLFLDQRINRQWVHNNSTGKKVLNLFSYTGAFSLNAGKGNAKSVTSVDISSNFINWSKQNFLLNNLNHEDPKFSFVAQDAHRFLETCGKADEKFDLIICDPPSFGRFGGSVFQIQKDWQKVLNAVIPALAPGGRILFTTTYERWNYDLFFNKIEIFALKKGLKAVKTPLGGMDFESPQESPLLKSVFLIHV